MRIIITNSVGGVGLPAAQAALLAGRPALDVVEQGIRPVEIDPEVDSVGVGGWPNLLGDPELDASIMDGRTLESGAVGALQGFLHPISVARKVMEELPHVFLAGAGAARFAAEQGAEAGPTLTDQSWQGWDTWLETHLPPEVRAKWPDVPLSEWACLTADPETAGGTTVYLVKDGKGDLAVGVSTSGWAWKYPGRLGDSPVIGAGAYADNRYGAAACTGMGELAIRAGTARSVVLYMKMGMTIEEACREAAADLRDLKRAYRGGVTIHAIDAAGRPHVLSIGRGDQVRYWQWSDDTPEPEHRQAVIEMF